MLTGEPRLVADISEWSWGDTEVRGRIIDVVTSRFLGRKWPTYGEKMNIPAFVDNLKKAALAEGFSSLATSEPDSDNGSSTSHSPSTTSASLKRWDTDRGPVTTAERWAFTTNEYDMALRSKVYAVHTGLVARKALATMFPSGTASDEISRKAAGRAENEGASRHASSVVDSVVDEIAKEVLELAVQPNRLAG